MIEIKNSNDLSKLFKEDDKPVEFTESQQKVFNLITKKEKPRNIIITPTRFGKSFTVALGVIIRAITFNEKWCIVAPSEKKARIIMNYIIQHVFDSPIFHSQLEVEGSLEKLRRERSKERLTFKRGGEIFILSADTRNKQAAGEALMGFGSENLIIDESSLIDDDIYAKAKRMLGDKPEKSFLLEIGNPFRRNHFMKSWRSARYNKIFVDWKMAYEDWKKVNPVKAKAYYEFVMEMREERDFDVLFECKFPEEDEVDDKGWFPLFYDNEIEGSMGTKIPIWGDKQLGVDVAGGGKNLSVWVLRGSNAARVLRRSRTPNQMEIVGITRELMKEHNINPRNVFIDIVGIGRGVYDRLKEQGMYVEAISGGTKAKPGFSNLRAMLYDRTRKWIRSGGKLEKDDCWFQLTDIRYKHDSSDKMKIIPKEELKKRGIESPDEADALSFTFFNRFFSEQMSESVVEEESRILNNRRERLNSEFV